MKYKYFTGFNPSTVLIALLIVLQVSCKKLVETPPPTEVVTGANAYSSDATAIAVLNGIYISMNDNGIGKPTQGIHSVALLSGLSSDELMLFKGLTGGSHFNYYRNSLSAQPTLPFGSELWAPIYNYIFKCNEAIEGIIKAEGLTPAVNRQLLGEAKFLRAYFYFYIVNLFGDVPLVLKTDPESNSRLARSSQVDIYQQIILDLIESEELLSDDFLSPNLITSSTERVRPTKWAAASLLARVYLYIGDWAKAEGKANVVINNSSLFGPLPPLNNAFLKNSREAIWQIQPTAINFNTQEARTLVIPTNGPNPANPVFLSKDLLNSFEANDKRRDIGNWVNSAVYPVSNNPIRWDTVFYAYKYKLNQADPNITSTTGTANIKEYFMVLRLSEQYLIRSEARARQNNLSAAVDDLDKIRERAGLPLIAAMSPGISQTALLEKILHERQVELFCESGHRWFDLKRAKKIDQVMSVVTPQKANGAPWQSYQQLYPLPLTELQRAPNLVQNSGY